jgi:hypothetical protein
MAYVSLGTLYDNLGERSLSMENTKKGYELRDRVTERERLYIEFHYFDDFTGDLEKARQAGELWAQMYPGDLIPRHNLVWIFDALGQYDKCFAEALETSRLDPDDAQIVHAYALMNRLDKASAKIRYLQAKHDAPGFHFASLRVTSHSLRTLPSWGWSQSDLQRRILKNYGSTLLITARN